MTAENLHQSKSSAGNTAEKPHGSHMSIDKKITRSLRAAAPWIAASLAVLLIISAATVVVSSYRGAANVMQHILSEKGGSLIRSFEAGARMRVRHLIDLRLQLLLEEMANQSDIVFTALIDTDGRVLAHSDASQLGLPLFNDEILKSLSAHKEPQWITPMVQGEEVFVVYKNFRPLQEQKNFSEKLKAKHEEMQQGFAGQSDRDTEPKKQKQDRPEEKYSGKKHNDKHSMAKHDNADPLLIMPDEERIMLVGLDIGPLRGAQKRDNFHFILILIFGGGTALMAGLALWWFHRERVAHQQVARLEAEIRRREKQVAMGNLAAGVAHELRNPLSSIKGYATYFGSRFAEGSEDRYAAGIMVQEVDRLNRVITDLINLSRPSDLRLVEHSGAESVALVERALHLIQHDAEARGVTLHFEAEPHLPVAQIDPDRFLQALLNVWLNGMDAMAKQEKGSAQLFVTLSNAHGHLCIASRDVGAGISPENLSKICDPYFTTKAQGTGLGLAIVQKIIEAHGGVMEVDSVLQEGTTVRFIL